MDVYKEIEFFEESKILDEELRSRLDDGEDRTSIQIDFENRLWRMKKENVKRDSPKYRALEMELNSYRRAVTFGYYEKKGWHQKYSGEWIRKEK